MKAIRKDVIAKIREHHPKVLDIHCICHDVSLCVKSAMKVLSLKIEAILVDIYYHCYYSVKNIPSLKEYAQFFMKQDGLLYTVESSILLIYGNLYDPTLLATRGRKGRESKVNTLFS